MDVGPRWRVTPEAPLFIGGLDHSGKTPLRIALDQHPRLTMIRRLPLWTELYPRHAFARTHQQQEQVLDALVDGPSKLQLDRSRLRAASAGGYSALVEEVGRQVCARAGTARWGSQEAMVEWRAEILLRALPDARIVQLVRDPRERLAAMMASGDVGRIGLAGELAGWIADVRLGLRLVGERPSAVMILRYESLVRQPEASLRAVCDFAQIDYRDEVLSTGPLSADDRDRLMNDLGRSTRVLSADELRFVERCAAAEMAALGYTPTAPPVPAGMLPLNAGEAARWQLGRLGWWLRSRPLRIGAKEVR